MFIQAIEVASKFTRPIHSISRNYGSKQVSPGTAALFFVNKDGWALTCGHVANQIIVGEEIGKKSREFKSELSSLLNKRYSKKEVQVLEKKYGYSSKIIFELNNMFINCVEGGLNMNIIIKNEVDIALIKFHNYSKLLCEAFPVFPKDTTGLKQGKFLCRLGFPFPEFNNYEYDEVSDSIQWTDTGRIDSPSFPIEGMLTRNLTGVDNNIVGFELSTPGLRGQSGGPVFDFEGKIWGMQISTTHLDLNFDVDQDVLRNGTIKRIQDSTFLHVGHCINVNTLKKFMKENKVDFIEG